MVRRIRRLEEIRVMKGLINGKQRRLRYCHTALTSLADIRLPG